MKLCLSLAFLLLAVSVAQAQIEYEQVKPLFGHLEAEDYEAAWSLSGRLITEAMSDGTDEDDFPLIGIVRYARLFSGARLIGDETLTYDDVRPVAKELEGGFVMMPGHPTRVDSTGEADLAFNTNTITVENDSIVVSTTTSNDDRTIIYTFEYVHLDSDSDVAELDGSNTRCGGRLARVEFNPNESLIWIMRLIIEDGAIQEM